MYDFEELDFYELLGVPRSASPDEIKRAYRREIARYHPDRYVNADPADLEYARRRSQLLTEAYATLSNPAARSAYNLNRRRSTRTPSPRPTPPPPPVQRDHQAELYQQARDHIDAGRYVQAVAVLRQLHQINPFYRDSAELLASAEAHLRTRASAPRRSTPPGARRRLILVAGTVAVLVIVGGALWWSGGQEALRFADAGQGMATVAPTSAPSPAPVATVPVVPTQSPLPSPAPASPTLFPTQSPREPSATPAPTDIPLSPTAEGTLLLRDDSFIDGWASARRTSWSVGPRDGRYRIAAEAQVGVIWSYRSVPADDVSVTVDVEVVEGEGGVILRFRDERNYLIFTVAPQTGNFLLEQVRDGTATPLAVGTRDDLRAADGRFRLNARIRDRQIRIVVNDQVAVETDVSSLPAASRYGLAVVARDTRAEAWFDNLEIRALP
ncbi:MAG: DnaJ domain-containing protein [Roseiflexus sp.]|uniref:J domain-containing protein n=1 Tax=Roseiflexus sp. TaxID=2562120 RepID=UPI0025FD21B0|nr:J domain-containing protein [Roseiflexus sp.]MCL6540943.1 DnaJ domain-containing protein [Roseiflexus sp.]